MRTNPDHAIFPLLLGGIENLLLSQSSEGKKLTSLEEDDGILNKYLPLEFLKKLEGVKPKNIPHLAKTLRNIYELNLLSEEKMQQILGNVDGSKLFHFLHNQIIV